MTTFVGLLRAVNLGSHNKIAMGDLRGLLADLGLHDPRTLLQSGNVVFASDERSSARLERLLETAAEKRLGLKTSFFVRSAGEWARVVENNPFPDAAQRDPGHLVMLALKGPPVKGGAAALQKAVVGREIVHAIGREAYIVYPDGIGRSRLTTALIEKHLGTPGTARNWNTVLKLAAATT
jgi:uncharacterized protein (DUF1697 family)